MKIHYCNWASQPNVGLLCSEELIYAGFATPVEEDVFDADGVVYTFDRDKANCFECLDCMSRGEE